VSVLVVKALNFTDRLSSLAIIGKKCKTRSMGVVKL